MSRLSTTITAVVVVGVAATSCTSTEAAPPSTQAPVTTEAVVEEPTSTIPPTTAAPTTTTPLRSVKVAGDLPQGMVRELAVLYSWLADDRNPEPGLPEGLGNHLGGTPPFQGDETTATASIAELPGGGSVAVIRVDGDVLLAADEGDGWRIVGAKLSGAAPWYGEEPRMVLVIGSDARRGQDQPTFRADSIHLITAVPFGATGSIVGFPRDSYLATPYGSMKFSSLMAGRGPEVMLDQVVETWGLPVEGYVVTGFKGFEDLMSELGRLVIELPRAAPSLKDWPGFPAGKQTLSPQRTLELARTRKGVPGGDLGRSLNQGWIMLATLRMLQTNAVDGAPQLVALLLDHVWTDLPPSSLIQLAVAALEMDVETVPNVVLPGRLGRAGAASVIYLEPGADEILADLGDDGLLSDG